MTEPELWAARDYDNDLNLFEGDPGEPIGGIYGRIGDGSEDQWLVGLSGTMLPDLKPGEKCRVKIERVDCTCPTLDGVQVTGSCCPVHGLESGEF